MLKAFSLNTQLSQFEMSMFGFKAAFFHEIVASRTEIVDKQQSKKIIVICLTNNGLMLRF